MNFQADQIPGLFSEEFVQHLFSVSREAICFVDREYCFISTNQAYLELIEKQGEDIQGKSLRDVQGAGLFELIKPSLDECFGTGKPVAFKGTQPESSDKPVHVSLTCFPAHLEQGLPESVGIVIHEHGENLEESPAAAGQVRSEFLSQMSHELRTPLNSILGYAELLLKDEKTPLSNAQLTILNPILSNGEHLLGLVNKIFDMANIEEEGLELNLEVFNPEIVLTECVNSMTPKIQKKEQEFIPAFRKHQIPAIKADRKRFRQTLLIFLTNAHKYTGLKGRLTLDSEVDGHYLRILVSDTGRGIKLEKQGQVFKPFHRLGMEHSQVSGAGIGLSLGKKYVEAMGGTIGFESQAGRGSTFWMRLPTAPEGQLPARVTSPAKTLEPARRKKICVLYVEDNDDNMILMELFLNKIGGVEFFYGDSGESGLSLAMAVNPELIFLDIHLPGISGYEVLQSLKELEQFEDVPVIALSADAMQESKVKANQLGFTEYMTKPFTLEDIKNIIEKYF